MTEQPSHWMRAEVIFAIDVRQWAEDYEMADHQAIQALMVDMRGHLAETLTGTALVDYATVDRITIDMGEMGTPKPARQQ